MDPTKFETFTKALATRDSRRQALRRIGGILGGTALAGLFPGLALADNSDCAHFCNSVFAPGPARGQCKSDAAHGTGLCYTCGPASPGGTQPICCPENSNGQCTSYSSATCCGTGQACKSGACVATCAGVVLSNGSCVTPCTDNSQCCAASPFCVKDVDGVHSYCSNGQGAGYCSNDMECGAPGFCTAPDSAGFILCTAAFVC